MAVQVYDRDGNRQQYEADTFEIDDDILWVKKDGTVVSAYSRGSWLNADVLADENEQTP